MGDGDFRSASADPRADGGGQVGISTLPEQRGADAGQNVAHAAGRHAGMAGGVVAQRAFFFGDDGAGAFEQKGDLVPVGKVACSLGAVFDFFAGEETGHFAGVRGEQARAFGLVEVLQAGVGDDGERVCVDHRGTRRFSNDAEGAGCVGGAETGADANGVDGEVEDVGEFFEGAHHDLGQQGGGEEIVDVGQRSEGNKAGTTAHGASGGQVGGTERAARTGEERDAAAIAFVGFEEARRPLAAQPGGGEHFGVGAVGIVEFRDIEHAEAADVVDGGVGDQAAFCVADCCGEIGGNARIAWHAVFGIESGGKIDGNGADVGRVTQGVHFARERGEGFAERSLRAEADERVELQKRAFLRCGWLKRLA